MNRLPPGSKGAVGLMLGIVLSACAPGFMATKEGAMRMSDRDLCEGSMALGMIGNSALRAELDRRINAGGFPGCPQWEESYEADNQASSTGTYQMLELLRQQQINNDNLHQRRMEQIREEQSQRQMRQEQERQEYMRRYGGGSYPAGATPSQGTSSYSSGSNSGCVKNSRCGVLHGVRLHDGTCHYEVRCP